jgi:hypothetical protein
MNASPPQVPQDPRLPPGQIKSSLKTGKFPSSHCKYTTPRQTKSTSADLDDEEDDPGIYSKTVDGVGDGTHPITTSFIKTNDKIRDQLLKNLYFSDLMHANIDGLKIHPISTKKPLPILTSPKDKNIPTTGNNNQRLFFYTEPVLPCPRNLEQTKRTPQEGRF